MAWQCGCVSTVHVHVCRAHLKAAAAAEYIQPQPASHAGTAQLPRHHRPRPGGRRKPVNESEPVQPSSDHVAPNTTPSIASATATTTEVNSTMTAHNINTSNDTSLHADRSNSSLSLAGQEPASAHGNTQTENAAGTAAASSAGGAAAAPTIAPAMGADAGAGKGATGRMATEQVIPPNSDYTQHNANNQHSSGSPHIGRHHPSHNLADASQIGWLQRQLKASTAPWKVR